MAKRRNLNLEVEPEDQNLDAVGEASAVSKNAIALGAALDSIAAGMHFCI